MCYHRNLLTLTFTYILPPHTKTRSKVLYHLNLPTFLSVANKNIPVHPLSEKKNIQVDIGVKKFNACLFWRWLSLNMLHFFLIIRTKNLKQVDKFLGSAADHNGTDNLDGNHIIIKMIFVIFTKSYFSWTWKLNLAMPWHIWSHLWREWIVSKKVNKKGWERSWG